LRSLGEGGAAPEGGRPGAAGWIGLAAVKRDDVPDSEGPPDHWVSAYTPEKIGVYPLPGFRGSNEEFKPWDTALRSRGAKQGLGRRRVSPPPPLGGSMRAGHLTRCAGGSPLRISRSVDLFCENLRRDLAGEPLLSMIDKQKGY
jgi:hypothetical protein